MFKWPGLEALWESSVPAGTTPQTPPKGQITNCTINHSLLARVSGRKEGQSKQWKQKRSSTLLSSLPKCQPCKIRNCPRNKRSTYTSPKWSHFSLRGLYWKQASLAPSFHGYGPNACSDNFFSNQFHGLIGIVEAKVVHTGLQTQPAILSYRMPTLDNFCQF